MTKENAIVYFNQISASSPEAEMAYAIATDRCEPWIFQNDKIRQMPDLRQTNRRFIL